MRRVTCIIILDVEVKVKKRNLLKFIFSAAWRLWDVLFTFFTQTQNESVKNFFSEFLSKKLYGDERLFKQHSTCDTFAKRMNIVKKFIWLRCIIKNKLTFISFDNNNLIFFNSRLETIHSTGEFDSVSFGVEGRKGLTIRLQDSLIRMRFFSSNERGFFIQLLSHLKKEKEAFLNQSEIIINATTSNYVLLMHLLSLNRKHLSKESRIYFNNEIYDITNSKHLLENNDCLHKNFVRSYREFRFLINPKLVKKVFIVQLFKEVLLIKEESADDHVEIYNEEGFKIDRENNIYVQVTISLKRKKEGKRRDPLLGTSKITT